jgi:hypothetical protein
MEGTLKERNSEMKMVWVVIGLIGAQLLGIDMGQLLSLLTNAQQHLSGQGSQAGGVNVGDFSLPALVGIYAWGRTKLKSLTPGGTVNDDLSGK